MNKKTLLKNAKIYNGTTDAAFVGDVLIEGDRIAEVAPSIAAFICSMLFIFTVPINIAIIPVSVFRARARIRTRTLSFLVLRGSLLIFT